MKLDSLPLIAAGFALLGCAMACSSATQGGVERPQSDGLGSVEYCAKFDSDEANCMACASKPGCGFCAEPLAGASVCQPGKSGADHPATCALPLTIGNDACAPPPPPVVGY